MLETKETGVREHQQRRVVGVVVRDKHTAHAHNKPTHTSTTHANHHGWPMRASTRDVAAGARPRSTKGVSEKQCSGCRHLSTFLCAGFSLFPAGNCNCRMPRLAQLGDTSYTTPALCGQQCAANPHCRSFGVWTAASFGTCNLFDTICTSPCAAPTVVSGGWTNDVYNMNPGVLLLCERCCCQTNKGFRYIFEELPRFR